MKNKYKEILAVDHRVVFSNRLSAKLGDNPVREDYLKYKKNIVNALKGYVNGILIEPAASGIVDADDKELYLSLEGDDYSESGFNPETYLAEGESVSTLIEKGADTIKLFMYMDLFSPTLLAKTQLLKKVSDECKKHDVTFLFEPIIENVRWSERVDIMNVIKALSEINIDILKIKFPSDSQDEMEMRHACREVTKAFNGKWIILSSGMDFEGFKRQLSIAMEEGCSGYAAGRSLWGPYVECAIEDEEQEIRAMQKRAAELHEIMERNKHD